MPKYDWLEHPSFCGYPWSHQLVDTEGTLKVCCHYMGNYGTAATMKDDWNRDYMKDVRRRMISGEKITECETCHRDEAGGRISTRRVRTYQWLRDDSEAERMIYDSIENGYHVEKDPTYIELRFGNLCNLQCKMCTPQFSSQIFKDYTKLKATDPEYFEQEVDNQPETFIDMNFDWYNDPEVWKNIDALIPNLIKISFTGGEPTMIKQYVPFLRRIHELGYAKNIQLNFSTNMTNVSDKLIDAIIPFQSNGITMSIDGTRDVYEYVRYPGKWPKIRENTIKFLDKTRGTTVRLYSNFVVQAYNILTLTQHIDDLLALHEEHNDYLGECLIHLNCIDYPNRYSIEAQHPEVRALALKRLQEWRKKHDDSTEFFKKLFERGALDTIEHRLIHGVDGPTPAEQLRFAKFMDSNKKIDLEANIPELHAMWTEIAASEENV